MTRDFIAPGPLRFAGNCRAPGWAAIYDLATEE
jgi:hypothetical protein